MSRTEEAEVAQEARHILVGSVRQASAGACSFSKTEGADVAQETSGMKLALKGMEPQAHSFLNKPEGHTLRMNRRSVVGSGR
jgi:hypothetical protein